MKILNKEDFDKENIPKAIKKDLLKKNFKDYLYNGKNNYDVKDDSYLFITKNGKVIKFSGDEGNYEVDEKDKFKSPNWNEIIYAEYLDSDDYTFWYNKDANKDTIKN